MANNIGNISNISNICNMNTEQMADEIKHAIRDYLMNNGDAVINALQVGIDSSNIAGRMATYIMHRIK